MPREAIDATEGRVHFEMVCKGGGPTFGEAHDVETGELSAERKGEEASDDIHTVSGLKTEAHVETCDSLSAECIWSKWNSLCGYL